MLCIKSRARFFAFALLLAVLSGPLNARAWNAEGHMVVAHMAYKHLNPAAKAKCDSLIAVTLTNASNTTSNFVTAAVWADDFRTELGTANWHFINLAFSPDNTPTNYFVMPAFDVVQAINLCITNLQNTNSALTNQATYLRYLLHFVGDLHQPLHSITALTASHTNGDFGGNLFTLTNVWTTLHGLWDEGGGYLWDTIFRPITPTGDGILSNKVAQIESQYPYSPHSGTIPNPMDWANEGRTLAQTVCYVGITNGRQATATYTNTAQATARARLALGGQRLADLLNTIYPSNPFTLTSVGRTNGKLAFTWSANAGQTYRVQWKGKLTDASWSDLTNITATGGSVNFSEFVGTTGRFYRVAQ